MNRKLLVAQWGWLLLCAVALGFHEWGMRWGLPHALENSLLPAFRRLTFLATDIKFRVRGPTKPVAPVVVVEIDSPSIESLGRWPWRRDYIAYLIEKIFDHGASVVGLDLLFSEAQRPIPEELETVLKQRNLVALAAPFDFDAQLGSVIEKYRERLVMAWASESVCRPAFFTSEGCPLLDPRAWETHPQDFARYAISAAGFPPDFDFAGTPVPAAVTLLPNTPFLRKGDRIAGFVNDFRDSDGTVRRTSPFMIVQKRTFGSLALQMASVARAEVPVVEWTSSGRVRDARWSRTSEKLPVNSQGMMQLGFKGPERTFAYVSAIDVLQGEGKGENAAILKGAHVLVGLSALALGDVVATPFDAAMPGVEVHATALHNLLAGDALVSKRLLIEMPLLGLALLIVGLLIIGLGARTSASKLVLLGLGTLAVLFAVDAGAFVFYKWNTDLVFVQVACAGMLGLTLAGRYVIEERNRQFLRSAFSKYVAPAVVDNLIRNPEQLSLGGRRATITVLFCDIRSFTSYSEKMPAAMVSKFLNDYLGKMTELVFQTSGTLDKYIGDAVMAFWGAPLALADHAAKASLASVQMVETVRRERERFRKDYGVPVRIGIGLNCGEVSVGNMGSERSFNYTVIGDEVNLASRLEAATKHFGCEILATQAVIDACGSNPPRARKLGSVRVKGKQNAVEVSELVVSDFPEGAMVIFESARQDFLARRWEKARAGFAEANRVIHIVLREPDGPSQLYLGTIENLIACEPPPDWDGVWETDK